MSSWITCNKLSALHQHKFDHGHPYESAAGIFAVEKMAQYVLHEYACNKSTHLLCREWAYIANQTFFFSLLLPRTYLACYIYCNLSLTYSSLQLCPAPWSWPRSFWTVQYSKADNDSSNKSLLNVPGNCKCNCMCIC